MSSTIAVKQSGRRTQVRRLVRRVISIAITLLGLLLLAFTIGRALPADPVLAITGPEVDKATYERVYLDLGLDRPVWEQFATYVGDVVTGDFGVSIITGHPVFTDLQAVVPATLELAIVAILVGSIIGVPLGVLAAARRNSLIDHIARIIGLAGYSVPIFWLGLLALLLFYAKLHWVAASGRIDLFNEGLMDPITGMTLIDSLITGNWEIFKDALAHIILPGSLLGYYSVAYISRMTRSFMLEQLSQEYIIAARAKGMSERAMIWRHAFKNIRVQLLTVLTLTASAVCSGRHRPCRDHLRLAGHRAIHDARGLTMGGMGRV